MKNAKQIFLGVLLMTTLNAGAADGPRIVMHTSMGVIEIETYPDQAPVTVANFVEYVEAGYYDGLVFHRVIPGFVIQGGGFESGMQPRENRAAIDNEADNGLKNERGTLSMARTQDPHSATSQFFINLADNGMLDHTGKNPQGWGYAVFARVTDGMETVDAIAAVATGSRGPFRDVPVEDVVIERAEVVGAE